MNVNLGGCSEGGIYGVSTGGERGSVRGHSGTLFTASDLTTHRDFSLRKERA